MTAMLLVCTRKCQQCRCHKSQHFVYQGCHTQSQIHCCWAVGWTVCLHEAKLFSIYENLRASSSCTDVCARPCWCVCVCVYSCVYKHVLTGESPLKNVAYYSAYLCLQIPPLLQVSACFCFSCFSMGPSADSMQSLYLTVHTAAMQFETKHTPVTQTNRPQSPLNLLSNWMLQQCVGGTMANWAKTKTSLRFKPYGTCAALRKI